MSLIYDPSANNKPGKADALYLDNAVFKQKQNNIKDHESALKLDISALSAQEEIGGTECVGLLLKHWREVAETGDAFRNLGTGVVDSALGKMMMSINHIDTMMANSIVLNRGKNARINDFLELGKDMSLLPPISAPSAQFFFPKDDSPKPTNPFDDRGSYGGNQGSVGAGTDIWVSIVGEDDDVYRLVRSFPECKDMSDRDVHDFLDDFSENGCTYVSIANSIFYQFRDHPEEFEKIFGFSMTKGNDLNFRMLIIDIYMKTKNKIFIDDIGGMDAFIDYFIHHEDECLRKYSYLVSKGDVKSETDYYGMAKALWMSGITEITVDEDYTNHRETLNRLAHYCRIHGIDMDIRKLKMDTSIEQIQKHLDDGYSVYFSSSYFKLETESGWDVTPSLSGHSMSITGVTDDKRFRVSSWGRKLYYDPNDENNVTNDDSYVAVKLKLSPDEVDDRLATAKNSLEILKNTMEKMPAWIRPDIKSIDEMITKINTMNMSVFDEVGTYGVDPAGAKKVFGKGTPNYDEKMMGLLPFISQHYGPEFCNTDKLNELLDRIEKEGSSVAAEVNAVLKAFEGQPEKFMETFHFPLKGGDKEVNTNLLLIDYCLTTGALCGKDNISSAERVKNYCDKKGLTSNIQSLYAADGPKEVSKILEDGGVVICKAATDYIRDITGSDKVLGVREENSELMTISGIKMMPDKSGKLVEYYEVSICGKKYYVDSFVLNLESLKAFGLTVKQKRKEK